MEIHYISKFQDSRHRNNTQKLDCCCVTVFVLSLVDQLLLCFFFFRTLYWSYVPLVPFHHFIIKVDEISYFVVLYYTHKNHVNKKQPYIVLGCNGVNLLRYFTCTEVLF